MPSPLAGHEACSHARGYSARYKGDGATIKERIDKIGMQPGGGLLLGIYVGLAILAFFMFAGIMAN